MDNNLLMKSYMALRGGFAELEGIHEGTEGKYTFYKSHVPYPGLGHEQAWSTCACAVGQVCRQMDAAIKAIESYLNIDPTIPPRR